MQLHTPMSGNRTITLAEINDQDPGLENREVDEIIVESAADLANYTIYTSRLPKFASPTKLVIGFKYAGEEIKTIERCHKNVSWLVFTKAVDNCEARGGFSAYLRVDVYNNHIVIGQNAHCTGFSVLTYWNVDFRTAKYQRYTGYNIVFRGCILNFYCELMYIHESIQIYDHQHPFNLMYGELMNGNCAVNHFLLDNFTEATLILDRVVRMTIIGSKSAVRSRLTLRATFIGELVIKNADVTLLNTPECREVTLVNSSCTGEPLTTLLQFTASGSSGRFLDQRVNPPSCRDITPEASWTYEDGAFQFPEARAFPVESDLEIIYEPDDPDMYLE